MGKRQHTFLITTSTKIMSHIVAWVNQFSKASPNEMTCKLGFLLSSSSHPLQSPVHAAGERRCKWMCSRKYQPPLPSTVQVTAKTAVKFLFGLVRFSWHIIGTFKPRKNWDLIYTVSIICIAMCLASHLPWQHLWQLCASLSTSTSHNQSSGKPGICPWGTGLSIF